MANISGAIRHVKKGEDILRQGESGEYAYIIDSGRVTIKIEKDDGSVESHEQGPGALFGEVALLAKTKRAATVTAIEDCTLITVTPDDFVRRIEASDPILKLVTKNLISYCRTNLEKDEGATAPLDNARARMKNVESKEQTDALLNSFKVEHALNKALDNNELELFYQPIIDLKTYTTCGFEALMRWNHPTDGMIPPNVFIPVAEDTGLIVKLSEWALREATSALERIQALPNASEHLYVSVNFSSHDLSKPSFLDELIEAVNNTKLHPKQVKIEITERLLILQPEVAAKTLKACKDAGFSIAIDDFGTGYSSLSYLQDFPIDTLKIDRAFVQKMATDSTSEELIRTIIQLGKTLDMDIIAEGAENADEVRKLTELNCDMVQGYYFAKPVPEKDIAPFFKNWRNE
ncbi:MAG: EAL domain-containing protein [Pseudomonadota bacterium]|nr:EAL domain-containing protein [Pseudomonadota bacterium]